VLDGRFEGLGDLLVGQDLSGHLGVWNFLVDLIFSHFLINQQSYRQAKLGFGFQLNTSLKWHQWCYGSLKNVVTRALQSLVPFLLAHPVKQVSKSKKVCVTHTPLLVCHVLFEWP